MEKLPRLSPLTARVGFLGVGHAPYWGQFEGLRDDMLAKLAHFDRKLAALGVERFGFGLIDSAEAASRAAAEIEAAQLDLLFVDMVTYATSATFGALVRHTRVPIVLVALQPLSAMPYERASTYVQLNNDDFCAVPEFTGVAIRLGRPVQGVVLGMLDGDAEADAELAEWCRIAMALHSLRHARIGLMGHALENMYDMQADPTALTAAFGLHVAMCEPDEVLREHRAATREEIDAKKALILKVFDTPDPVSDPVTTKLTEPDLEEAARTAVALDRFIRARNLTGLAYYYEAEEGTPMRRVVTNFIVGNSLLTSAGFPMCGEFDIKTCVAMLLMDRLGIGGSFAEFHPIDFARDSVLVGHDGPHHLNIAEGKPVLRSLLKYHGKPGSGAGVEFNIKEGPITMLSIGVKADGRFKFVVAEGESIHGPIPPTGNTNTHGRFKPDVRTFLRRWVMEGPTHHFALGVGHHARALRRIAAILGVECVVVE